MVQGQESEALGAERSAAGRQIDTCAGRGGSLKSLRELILAKRFGKAFRFDDNKPERPTIVLDADGETVEYESTSLPLYAIAEFAGAELKGWV